MKGKSAMSKGKNSDPIASANVEFIACWAAEKVVRSGGGKLGPDALQEAIAWLLELEDSPYLAVQRIVGDLRSQGLLPAYIAADGVADATVH